ncbi:MAG: hypothetical protein ACT6Q5_08930 [Sphingopyxis solisilvae]|uniref:hypothetical protein n=1 Tax=Sphingopyxis solisilvae TaxID=1886788 RepID=UPI004035CBE3
MTIEGRPGWQLLDELMTEDVAREIGANFPDVDILRAWIDEELCRQTGISGWTSDDDAEQAIVSEWLIFQMTSAIFVTKQRHLRHLLFRSYSDKLISTAQRPCLLCGGLAPSSEHFPVHTIPVRLGPSSRQTLGRVEWAAFQAAIEHWFAKKQITVVPGRKYCIALTFVLGRKRRNRDLDNMAKALMDAFSRAIGFDDADVHHLDLIKFIGTYDEEYVTIRMQPSHLGSDLDVLSQHVRHDFAVADPVNLTDFMPTAAPISQDAR